MILIRIISRQFSGLLVNNRINYFLLCGVIDFLYLIISIGHLFVFVLHMLLVAPVCVWRCTSMRRRQCHLPQGTFTGGLNGHHHVINHVWFFQLPHRESRRIQYFQILFFWTGRSFKTNWSNLWHIMNRRRNSWELETMRYNSGIILKNMHSF